MSNKSNIGDRRRAIEARMQDEAIAPGPAAIERYKVEHGGMTPFGYALWVHGVEDYRKPKKTRGAR